MQTRARTPWVWQLWSLPSLPGRLAGHVGVSTCVVVLLAGCHATGARFDAAADLAPPADRAHVIVYRSRDGHAAGTWPQLSLERSDDPSTRYAVGRLKRGGFVTWVGPEAGYLLIPAGHRLTWPWQTGPVSVNPSVGETLFVRLDMQGHRASKLVRCGEDTHTVNVCEARAARPAFEVVPRNIALAELKGLAREEPRQSAQRGPVQ